MCCDKFCYSALLCILFVSGNFAQQHEHINNSINVDNSYYSNNILLLAERRGVVRKFQGLGLQAGRSPNRLGLGQSTSGWVVSQLTHFFGKVEQNFLWNKAMDAFITAEVRLSVFPRGEIFNRVFDLLLSWTLTSLVQRAVREQKPSFGRDEPNSQRTNDQFWADSDFDWSSASFCGGRLWSPQYVQCSFHSVAMLKLQSLLPCFGDLRILPPGQCAQLSTIIRYKHILRGSRRKIHTSALPTRNTNYFLAFLASCTNWLAHHDFRCAGCSLTLIGLQLEKHSMFSQILTGFLKLWCVGFSVE